MREYARVRDELTSFKNCAASFAFQSLNRIPLSGPRVLIDGAAIAA